MKHYTYMITDTVNKMFYVGVRSCDCDPEEDPYMSSSKHVKEAMEKHGKDNFVKMVMDVFSTREEANGAEERFLVANDARNTPIFYNKTNGDKDFCTFGVTLPNEHIGKLAELSRQRWAEGRMQGSIESTKQRWAEGKMNHVLEAAIKGIKSPDSKVRLKGDSRTPAQKLGDIKNSLANKGKKKPKISEKWKKEGNPFYGKKHTEETKKRVSEDKFGKLINKNKSGVVGVCKTQYGTWSAYICKKGINKHLGTFPTKDLAIEARKNAEKQSIDSVVTTKIKKCPHCGKEGSGGNMTRYHFDNCKYRGVDNG